MFKKRNPLTATLIALSLATAPIMGAVTPVMAAENVTNTTGHAYEAYQIFSGTQGDSSVLGNVQWGSAIPETQQSSALNAVKAIQVGTSTPFASCTSAAEIAEVLAKPTVSPEAATAEKPANDQNANALAFAKAIEPFATVKALDIAATDTTVNLDAGYYLLKDVTEPTSGQEDYVRGLSLLQVTKNGNVEIQAKVTKPSVDKQVEDDAANDADGNGTVNGTFAEGADHSIGEVFKFKIEAEIPVTDGFKAFDYYQAIMTDTFSKGVDYVGNPVVYVGSIADENKLTKDTDYEITEKKADSSDTSSRTTGLTITLGKTKTVKDDNNTDVVIRDIKSLDKVAAITTGNIKFIVVYDAKLNNDAVTNEKSDQNIVKGDTTANTNSVKLTYSNNPNASGNGGLTTSDTPEDHVFVFSYTLNNTKVDKADTNKTLSGAVFEVYLGSKTEANKLSFIKTNDGYKLATEEEIKEDKKIPEDQTHNVITGITSGTDGTFKVYGLDAGTYIISEKTAPNGYNIAQDQEIVIKATKHTEKTEDGKDLGIGQLTLTQDGTEKTLGVTVEDSQGSTLPETGGMGTTIFTTIGGLLMAGAALGYFGTKRKQN